jgi:hypothetical protein
MRRTLPVCLIFSTVYLFSCNYIPAKKKLMAYAEISSTNDSLTRMTREWYRLLSMSVTDKNFSRLSSYRLHMGEFLSNHRDLVANLQAGPNGQNIVDSEEVFLANEATTINDLYSSFESYNEMTPVETVNGQIRKLSNDQSNEMTWTAVIKRSLANYLKKNKLKVTK